MHDICIHAIQNKLWWAVFEETEEARIGVIIRNSRGEVMASLLEKIPYPSSIEVQELLAARRDVLFV